MWKGAVATSTATCMGRKKIRSLHFNPEPSSTKQYCYLLDAQIRQQSFVQVAMKLNITPTCAYCIIYRT